jgi:undecaprenyl diphosphate synthase
MAISDTTKLLPKHVSLIMDGNRRWAKQNNIVLADAYSKGADRLEQMTEYAKSIEMKYLSAFALSSENLQRPSYEILIIKKVLKRYLARLQKLQRNQKINFKSIGDIEYFDSNTQQMIRELESNHYPGELTLIVALNYSGKNDLLYAINKCYKSMSDSDKHHVTENDINQHLMTADIPPPDLLIRTSGEKRISNFMLWQCAYSELYFTDVFWPSFSVEDFEKALELYVLKQRRFGQ